MNIGKKNKIFLGSKNKGKISDWKRYFINLEIVHPYTIDKFINVIETSESIFKNAKNKTIEWSKLTNLITVSDDTGFFIPALDNKPGVSVKTFGGELPEDRTDAEFIKHIYNRTREIDNLYCYFQSAIAFAKSGEIVKEDSYKIEGELDFSYINLDNINIIEEGYPVGMIFKPKNASKPWSFLNEAEKMSYDSEMIETINRCINELY